MKHTFQPYKGGLVDGESLTIIAPLFLSRISCEVLKLVRQSAKDNGHIVEVVE